MVIRLRVLTETHAILLQTAQVDHGVAMALLALGEIRRLHDLLDIATDDTGLLFDMESLPKRIRQTRGKAGSGETGATS